MSSEGCFLIHKCVLVTSYVGRAERLLRILCSKVISLIQKSAQNKTQKKPQNCLDFSHFREGFIPICVFMTGSLPNMGREIQITVGREEHTKSIRNRSSTVVHICNPSFGEHELKQSVWCTLMSSRCTLVSQNKQRQGDAHRHIQPFGSRGKG